MEPERLYNLWESANGHEVYVPDQQAVNLAELLRRTESGAETRDWEVYSKMVGGDNIVVLKKFTFDGGATAIKIKDGVHKEFHYDLKTGQLELGEGYIMVEKPAESYRAYISDVAWVHSYGLDGSPNGFGTLSLATDFRQAYEKLNSPVQTPTAEPIIPVDRIYNPGSPVQDEPGDLWEGRQGFSNTKVSQTPSEPIYNPPGRLGIEPEYDWGGLGVEVSQPPQPEDPVEPVTTEYVDQRINEMEGRLSDQIRKGFDSLSNSNASRPAPTPVPSAEETPSSGGLPAPETRPATVLVPVEPAMATPAAVAQAAEKRTPVAVAQAEPGTSSHRSETLVYPPNTVPAEIATPETGNGNKKNGKNVLDTGRPTYHYTRDYHNGLNGSKPKTTVPLAPGDSAGNGASATEVSPKPDLIEGKKRRGRRRNKDGGIHLYDKNRPEGPEGIAFALGIESIPRNSALGRNEDAVLYDTSKRTRLGVSDGLRANPGGQRAADITRDMLKDLIDQIPDTIHPDKAVELMRQALIEANNRVNIDKLLNPEFARMQATASYLKLIRRNSANWIVWGNVGDSRIAILRDGKIIEITLDENKKDDNQMIGKSETIDPKANKFKLRLTDKVLLYTNGVHRRVNTEQLEELLRRKSSLGNMAQEVVDFVKTRFGEDEEGEDITFVAAKLLKSE